MAAWSGCFSSVSPAADGVAQISCLEPLFANVSKAVLSLAGLVLFIMLIVGGFNLLLSGGDQKKLETAKGTITAAIIGMVVMVLGYLILLTIKEFTGVDVTKFQVITSP